jgi:predicted RNase H-like HicB family nuclease
VKRTFSARVSQEDGWFVAQCLDVDVVSQGRSKREALDNLKEALELFFDEPTSTPLPDIEKVEVEIGAA